MSVSGSPPLGAQCPARISHKSLFAPTTHEEDPCNKKILLYKVLFVVQRSGAKRDFDGSPCIASSPCGHHAAFAALQGEPPLRNSGCFSTRPSSPQPTPHASHMLITKWFLAEVARPAWQPVPEYSLWRRGLESAVSTGRHAVLGHTAWATSLGFFEQ